MEKRNYFLVFCRNVKAVRQSCGMTKKQMSRILGVSPKTFNRIEAEEVPNIKVDQLDRFITHFHLNVEKACQIPFELWDKQDEER